MEGERLCDDGVCLPEGNFWVECDGQEDREWDPDEQLCLAYHLANIN